MKDDLVTSKEVIKKAGISRATLNNYIQYGIVPKPVVRAPLQRAEGATKIGHFPRWVIEKIGDVQAMKRKGKTMQEIARILSEGAIKGKRETAESDPSMSQPLHESTGVRELNSPGMHSFFSLCVLAAHFVDASRLKSELPAADYFELMNTFWRDTAEIFSRYKGIRGRYPGEGILCYFLKKPGINYILNSLKCALELIEKASIISREWQLRKGWFNQLEINVGIDEGVVFLGTVGTEHRSELVGLGDSITRAVRLSHLDVHGSVFATKDLVNKLNDQQKKSIVYGIRRRHPEKGDVFIEKSFSRVFDLPGPGSEKRDRFMDIGYCAVTEIASIR